MALELAEPMAKTKRTPDDDKANVTTTKVDPELLDRARMVAIRRKISLRGYVDGVLRPIVDKDFHDMIRNEAGKSR